MARLVLLQILRWYETVRPLPMLVHTRETELSYYLDDHYLYCEEGNCLSCAYRYAHTFFCTGVCNAVPGLRIRMGT